MAIYGYDNYSNERKGLISPMKRKWKNVRRGNAKSGHDESIKQLDNRVTKNANFNLQSPQSPSSFASFFLCIGEVLLEDATARFIEPLQALPL